MQEVGIFYLKIALFDPCCGRVKMFAVLCSDCAWRVSTGDMENVCVGVCVGRGVQTNRRLKD